MKINATAQLLVFTLFTILISIVIPLNASFAAGYKISIDKAVIGETSTVNLSEFPADAKFSIIKWWIHTPAYGDVSLISNAAPNTSVAYTSHPQGTTYIPNLTVPVACLDPVPATLNVEVISDKYGSTLASMPLPCVNWPSATFINPRIENLTRSTGEFLAGDRLKFSSDGISNPPPAASTVKSCWNACQVPGSGFIIGPSFTAGQHVGYEIHVNFYGYETPNLDWSGRVELGPTLKSTPLPLITGSPVVGGTITGNLGTWDQGVTLSYRWLNVAGASTYGTSLNLQLADYDLDRVLIFEVTGKKDGFIPVTLKSLPIKIGAGIISQRSSPRISEVAKVGELLIGDPGTWDTGVNLAYSWLIDGKPSSFQLLGFTPWAEHFSHKISLQVTASKTGYASTTALSNEVQVGLGNFKFSPTPIISANSTAIGQIINANVGSWDLGTTLNYQWLRDGSPLEGANSASYVITPSDSAHKLSISVKGTLNGIKTVIKTSNPVTVGLSSLSMKPNPVITGNPILGGRLSVQLGNWDSGVNTSVKWLRNGTEISGATNTNYIVTTDDQGNSISAKVIATKNGYNSEVVLSNNLNVNPAVLKELNQQPSSKNTPTNQPQSGVILNTQTAWHQPSVSGIPRLGFIFKAINGIWAPKEVFEYQWLRNGMPILKGNYSSYKVGSLDVGKNISVKVTGKLLGYKDLIKISQRVYIKK